MVLSGIYLTTNFKIAFNTVNHITQNVNYNIVLVKFKSVGLCSCLPSLKDKPLCKTLVFCFHESGSLRYESTDPKLTAFNLK